MKISQKPRHRAAKRALSTPGVRAVANYGVVKLHTRIFLGTADPDRREERRERLDAFFGATMDTDLAALQAGYDEAQARETTHIQVDVEFFSHGWTEVMEIPAAELDTHLDRYREFFDAHGISIEDSSGTFRPTDGLPAAPATPERLRSPEYRNATAGYADAVYVETPDGLRVGGGEKPEADTVDLTDAPGVGDRRPAVDDETGDGSIDADTDGRDREHADAD